MDVDPHHNQHQLHHPFTVPMDLHHFLNMAATSNANNVGPNSLQFPPPPPFSSGLYVTRNAALPPPPLQYPQQQSHHQHLDVNMGRQATSHSLHVGDGMCVGLGLHELESVVVPIGSNVDGSTASSGGGGSGNLGAFDLDGSEGAGGGRLCFRGSGGGGGSTDIEASGNSGRWPREETLALLEIRSKLDSKFKESNQKGPLWEEVSSIMWNEHGYKRTAKKCREKYDNLYKYYKKTKEGKAGRQDGKIYRFFRQLEALHGVGEPAASIHRGRRPASCSIDPQNIVAPRVARSNYSHMIVNSNHINHRNAVAAASTGDQYQSQAAGLSTDNSLSSLSDSSDCDTTSSNDDDHEQATLPGLINGVGPAAAEAKKQKKKKKKKRTKSWKAKMVELIDRQMRGLAEKQEAFMEKMMRMLEHKEQERMQREEQWKKQAAERAEREEQFWDNERAWIKTRDAAFVNALQKLMCATTRAAGAPLIFDPQQRDENQGY